MFRRFKVLARRFGRAFCSPYRWGDPLSGPLKLVEIHVKWRRMYLRYPNRAPIYVGFLFSICVFVEDDNSPRGDIGWIYNKTFPPRRRHGWAITKAMSGPRAAIAWRD